MPKFLTTGLVWLLIIGSYGIVYEKGGDAREAKIASEQAAADKNQAVAAIENWNTITSALMADAPKILTTKDDSTTGPAVAAWLPAPNPARKPDPAAVKASAHPVGGH